MYKKIITILLIAGCILGLFWLLIARPFVHQLKNDTDHSKLLFYFETIEHPANTKQLYYNDFFGNSSGTGNHCEHIFLEIRKYTSGNETIIKNYFNNKYPDIKLHFITSIEQCCQLENKYYVFCDFVDIVAKEQPSFTLENQTNKFPIYTIEYSDNGKHMADKRCY